MSELRLIIAGGMAIAILVLGAMVVVKNARIDVLDAALVERDGVIERQNRQSLQLVAAHKIEVIRGDNARAQVAAGDGAVKAADARAGQLSASLTAARKELANAHPSDDAPAAPVLVRAYERLREFAETYRRLRSGDGLLPGDGKAALAAGAADAPRAGVGIALTQRQFAAACVGTADAFATVASNIIGLRDDFEPTFNANVEIFNTRAKALALQGAPTK